MYTLYRRGRYFGVLNVTVMNSVPLSDTERFLMTVFVPTVTKG